MKKLSKLLTISVFSLYLFVDFSHANILKDIEQQNKNEGFIGLGAQYSTTPYKDDVNEILPVPIIKIHFKRLFVNETIFGIQILENNTLSLSIIGHPRFSGYNIDDSPIFMGMASRKSTLDAGLYLDWTNNLFNMSITSVTDIWNRHHGQEIETLFSKELFQGLLTPRFGFKWMSHPLTDYYFGVRDDEINPTRHAYSVNSTTEFVGGLSIGIPISGPWAIVGDISYERLAETIRKSPLVDSQEIIIYTAGAIYRF